MTSRCLGVCSWSLKPQNPKELVNACQECGINAVQLALLPLVQDSSWDDCGNILQDSGIEIISGMLEVSGEDYTTLETIALTGGLRQDSMWASTEDHANRVADIALELELPLVTFHAGFIPEHACDERNKMLNRLQILAGVFGKRGIQLGLETGQECASNVVSVLEDLSHPQLGVNYDPANMILYGKGDPIDAMKTLRPWVLQVHVKDAVETKVTGTWGTEVPVGEGDVLWVEFMQLVPEDCNLVIEREGGDQRVRDVKQAKEMLQGIRVC